MDSQSSRQLPKQFRPVIDWVLMPPNEIIGIEPVRERAIDAEKLAINAVMAGCLPMHFPAVVSAWMAMLKDEFLLHGTTAQHWRLCDSGNFEWLDQTRDWCPQ